MAPEIWIKGMENRIYGWQADVWSLGISLFIAVTGESPYHDGDLAEQVSAGSITWTTSIPEKIRNLLQKLLQNLCETLSDNKDLYGIRALLRVIQMSK
jgi:serine/threonine protein kinase